MKDGPLELEVSEILISGNPKYKAGSLFDTG